MNDTSRIRRATVADAAELARLLSPLGYPMTAEEVRERWTAWEAEGNVALVVGEDPLLGVVTLHRMTVLHRPRPVGRVTSVAVDPAAQGRGFGRALMAAAAETMAEAGCGHLEVTSHARRIEAHSFYRHLGYEQTSFRFARALDSAR